MLTPEQLKNITSTKLSEKAILNQVAEGFADKMLININMKLLEAARNGETELVVGKCFRKEGLLKKALQIAAVKITEKGLVANFSTYKKEGKTITVLKILW